MARIERQDTTSASEATKLQARDVHGPSDQHVTDKDESQGGLPAVTLLHEIVEMPLGWFEQFFVSVRVERCELVLGRGRWDILPGSTVEPMGLAFVDDGRLARNPIQRDADDSSLQELRERDAESP